MAFKLVGALTLDELIDAAIKAREQFGGYCPVEIEGCDCVGWATGHRIDRDQKCSEKTAERGKYGETILPAVFFLERDDHVPHMVEE